MMAIIFLTVSILISIGHTNWEGPTTERPTTDPTRSPIVSAAPAPSARYLKGPIASGYTAAAAYCQSQGTTLASIGNVIDWNHAKSVCGSDNCWIGLQDGLNGNDDGIWAWDDGIDITKSYGFNSGRSATTGQGPWDSGEPNEANGDREEDCVHMLPTGKYNDETCDGALNYYPLCNQVPVQRKYLRGPTQLKYDDASAYCQSEGGTVAVITTATEWNNAVTACGSRDCWIGARDEPNGNIDMYWSWDDGTRISNSFGFNPDRKATTGQGPWNIGEPNEYEGQQEDCVEMLSTGKYNDDSCDVLNYPLCSKIVERSVAARSVYHQILSSDNNGNWNNENNIYHGQDNDYNYNQYPDNDDVMNRYHGKDDNYKQYPDNYDDGSMNKYYEKDNENYNGIHINSNILWIVCGLMIINIICLTVYCKDYNKCGLNKNQKGYRVVKYKSENAQLV